MLELLNKKPTRLKLKTNSRLKLVGLYFTF